MSHMVTVSGRAFTVLHLSHHCHHARWGVHPPHYMLQWSCVMSLSIYGSRSEVNGSARENHVINIEREELGSQLWQTFLSLE